MLLLLLAGILSLVSPVTVCGPPGTTPVWSKEGCRICLIFGRSDLHRQVCSRQLDGPASTDWIAIFIRGKPYPEGHAEC